MFVILPDIEERFDSSSNPIVRSILVMDTWDNAGAFALIEGGRGLFDGIHLKIHIARQSIDIDSLLVQSLFEPPSYL